MNEGKTELQHRMSCSLKPGTEIEPSQVLKDKVRVILMLIELVLLVILTVYAVTDLIKSLWFTLSGAPRQLISRSNQDTLSSPWFRCLSSSVFCSKASTRNWAKESSSNSFCKQKHLFSSKLVKAYQNSRIVIEIRHHLATC